MPTSLGDRIKEIRKENSLTQLAFAKEVGISQTHVSKIEKGVENPSETLIKFICYKYFISEEWLKLGMGHKQPRSSGLNSDQIIIFNSARHEYEKNLALLNVSDELFESVLAFRSACEILNCNQLDVQQSMRLQYLENINRLFSELDALFSYAKSLSINNNSESACIEERYKYLSPKINETIKNTINDLFKK